MIDTTLLVIVPFGSPPYSVRGLTQILEPITQAMQVQRTINGEAVDLADDNFKKYKTQISCTDQDVPALSGVWPGAEVVIECVAELCKPVGYSPQFDRDYVIGSDREADGFMFYRPILTMLVTSYSVQKDEYGASVGWSLTAEEV